MPLTGAASWHGLQGRRSARPAAAHGSCRGEHHTDRHPGSPHATVRWPRPPVSPYADRTAGQSQRVKDTSTRPGPHSCPFWQPISGVPPFDPVPLLADVLAAVVLPG